MTHRLGTRIIGIATLLGMATGALLTISVAAPSPVAQAVPITCPGSKGCISTVAGGGANEGAAANGHAATDAHMVLPIDLVRVGKKLYVSDNQGQRVWVISLDTGIIDTLAGTGVQGSTGDGGPADQAEINQPTSIAYHKGLGSKGSILINGFESKIRRVDLATGVISTFAGDGTACPDPTAVSNPCGDGGPATSGQVGAELGGIAVEANGTVVFTDWLNHRVRSVRDINPVTGIGTLSTLAGNGVEPVAGGSPDGTVATQAELVAPARVVIRPSDGAVVFSDICERDAVLEPLFAGHPELMVSHCDGRIRVINGDGTLGTIAGKAPDTNFYVCQPGFALSSPHDWVNALETADPAAGTGCGDGGPATAASLRSAVSMRYDAAGRLFVGEMGGTFMDFMLRRLQNDLGLEGLLPDMHADIRCIGCVGPGIISTYAGLSSGFGGDGGPAANAQFDFPGAMTADEGTHIFVSDFWNGRIRRIEGPKPDMRVSLSTDGPLTAGEPGVVHVTVENASTDPDAYLTGPVSATVTLPEGLSFASASVASPSGVRRVEDAGSWSCDGSGQSAVCTTADNMAPQASSTFDITVNVAVDAPESVTVNANGSSDSDVANPDAQIAVLGIAVRRSVSSTGYVLAGSDGGTFAFGTAVFPGATDGEGHYVAGAPAGGHGAWLAMADGSVHTTGDAQFYGSLGGTRLNSPIVGIAGNRAAGYWLAGADGGVFAYGSAKFYGSLGATPLNKAIVGITATPSGKGYWLVAGDGGVFAEGDATFYGSLGATKLNSPIVGIRATGSGKGYYLVASDGGVFAYGDAAYAGSHADTKLNSPIVAIVPASAGYWLVAADGGVFAYGNATFAGSLAATRLNAPIVAAW